MTANQLKQMYQMLLEEYHLLQEENRNLRYSLDYLEDDLLAESLVDLLNSQPLPKGSQVSSTLSVKRH